jgi:hypothetical protein
MDTKATATAITTAPKFQVTLNLSLEEAQDLRELGHRTGGIPDISTRGVFDAINTALDDTGALEPVVNDDPEAYTRSWSHRVAMEGNSLLFLSHDSQPPTERVPSQVERLSLELLETKSKLAHVSSELVTAQLDLNATRKDLEESDAEYHTLAEENRAMRANARCSTVLVRKDGWSLPYDPSHPACTVVVDDCRVYDVTDKKDGFGRTIYTERTNCGVFAGTTSTGVGQCGSVPVNTQHGSNVSFQ